MSGPGSMKEHPRWSAMWAAGLQPGQAFDTTVTSPLLELYIRQDKVPFGRALVPGCGRGYDVTSLCHKDRYVLGLDIATDAVKAAITRRDEVLDGVEWKDNAQFQDTSFFELSPPEKFDFVYDYTFLCALDPSLRKDWASKMTELIRPGGELLTLVFPIIEDDSIYGDKGPPFRVNLSLYRELLTAVGFEELELRLLPPELCHEGRDGVKELMPGVIARSGVGRWRKI